MRSKSILSIAIISTLLSGCDLTDDEKDKLNDAAVDLEQLADQIIITYPANGAKIEDINALVRADIPSNANAKKLVLLVDGITVAEDTDGEPWEIEWPAYFFADNKEHNLLLKATTENDIEVRNTQQFQVVVPEELANSLTLSTENNQIQDTNQVSVSLTSVMGATYYEVFTTDQNGTSRTVVTETPDFDLDGLNVGVNTIKYRAVQETISGHSISGPWSQDVTQVTVMQPDAPVVNEAVYTQVEDGYQVTLSWSSEANNSYTVIWGQGEELNNEIIVDGTEYSFTVASLQDLNWQLMATNEFGHASVASEKNEIYPATQIRNSIQIPEFVNSSQLQNLEDSISIELPSDVAVTSVTILIDELELGNAELHDGYSYNIPSYFFADGDSHDLVVRITTEDNVVVDSQAFNFSVNTEVLNQLAFAQNGSNSDIKDQNDLQLNYSSIPGATSYEISVNDVIQGSNSTESTLTELQVGGHEVRYRAICTLDSGDSITGPWSDAMHFSVLAPDAPISSEPTVTWSSEEQHYIVEFSWEHTSDEDSYELVWDNGLSELTYPTSNNTITLDVADSGSYKWGVKRINEFGHASDISQLLDIGVGEFRTQLGGSKDEYGRKLLAAQNGDYLVLATTASREITPALDNGTDPWIIRMSNSGQVLSQFIYSEGDTRFYDILESSDGSIFLAGSDFTTRNSLLVKLSSDLELEWESTIKPEGVTERFDLTKIIEYQGSLLASGAEWKTEGSSTSRDSWYLLDLSLSTGDISSSKTFPQFDGATIDSVSKFLINSDGSILVAGTVEPTDGNEDYMNYGAFVANLDNELKVTESWHNLGEYRQGNVGDVQITDQGKIIIIGQSMMGGEPSISLLNSDLTEHAYLAGSYDDTFYNASSGIALGENDHFWTIQEDSDAYPYPHPMVLIEYNGNLVEQSRKYILDESGYTSERGLAFNEDGSITILFSKGQNGYKNHDLIIRRLNPNEE